MSPVWIASSANFCPTIAPNTLPITALFWRKQSTGMCPYRHGRRHVGSSVERLYSASTEKFIQ